MNRFLARLRRLSAVLLLGLPLSAAAQDDTLRLQGSNTLGARLMPALAEAWLRAEGYARINRSTPAPDELALSATRGAERLTVQIAAHGTGTGFEALGDGRADLAMASRPVDAGELTRLAALGPLDAPEHEAVVALDGVAVIVHPGNPLRQLDLAQLRQVFDGSVRDWRALGGAPGPIALHARDARSGTFETFRTLVLGERALRADARRHEGNQALAAAVARDPRAIGFVGLASIGPARALAIAEAGHALEPTAASVAVEDYALSRRLFLYRGAHVTPQATRLVEFALSPAGQAVVEAHGFVAQAIRPYATPRLPEAPAEYVALTRDAQRLSLNFRFGAGSRLLDGKMLRDLDRLAEFLRQPAQRDRPLLLIGFADAGEAVPYLATVLSSDRVDLVSRLLAERGVAATRLRGLGGALPVADNDSAQGRQRNRRVEVWLGEAGDGAGVSSTARAGD